MLSEKERWQQAHTQLCEEYEEHKRKHKEEFFALYADYEELKRESVILKEKNKHCEELEEENTKLKEEVENLKFQMEKLNSKNINHNDDNLYE